MKRIGLRFLLVAVLTALVIPAAAGASPIRWHTYRPKPAHGFAVVRCPSSAMCVALTGNGSVVTTTNASAKQPKWKLTDGLKVMGPEEDSEQLTAYNLACPSVHLCVTSDLSQIITTTNPTGPASAWHAVDIQPAGLDAEGKIDSLTCPSTTLCVAGMNEWRDEEGGGTFLELASSTNPTGGLSAWSVVPGPSNVEYMTQIACSPGGTCAGGDDFSGITVSSNPTGGTAAWSNVARLSDALDYVTCPSVALCIGADFEGRLASSAAPMTTAWHQAKLPGGRYLTTVSCSGTTFCGATGGDLHHVTGVLTSSHPASASRWTLTTFQGHGDRMVSISCRSSAFCVAVGDDGLVAVRRRGA